MKIQTMLLPHKHVRFSSSLVAIAGYIRGYLVEPKSVDELWAVMSSDRNGSMIKPSFTQLVLAVDVLFAIQVAEATPDGRVYVADHSRVSMKSEDKGSG
ncbi:ABC-three component system middle component 6 [Halomonas sp. H10-9-1]|uniref:ABC-three component system middle component 6 n=1 Tax=Halomonas sp. H10-9-1 TaxID=2950871 RepID=UPI0032DEF21B